MFRVKCKSIIIYLFTCLDNFIGFFSSNVCINISDRKELCVLQYICYKEYS